MKAGIYYVGDLCYIIKRDLWSELCDEYFLNENEVFEFKGVPIFQASTAYGDGTYEDKQGRSYCVDSGTIGCIAIGTKIINEERLRNAVHYELGHIITFNKDFHPSYENGIFHFDGLVINTQYDEEEEVAYEW